MARILVRGATLGVPLVFVVALILMLAAGARGAGALFIAAWAALIGGIFIGSGILLARDLGALGLPARTPQDHTPPEVTPEEVKPQIRPGVRDDRSRPDVEGDQEEAPRLAG